MSEVFTGEVTIRNTENDKKFYGLKWQLDYPITEVGFGQLSGMILADQNRLEKKLNILLKFNRFEWAIEGSTVVFQPEFVCATHFIPKNVKINYIPVYENPSDLTQVPNSEENAVNGT